MVEWLAGLNLLIANRGMTQTRRIRDNGGSVIDATLDTGAGLWGP